MTEATGGPVRRRRSGRASGSGWVAQLPYAAVLAGTAGGLVWISLRHFRRGSMLIALVVFLGALLRLVLPEERVGLLAVRPRIVDVLTLAALGAGLAIIALWVPPPS